MTSATPVPPSVRRLIESGGVGGRTVQINRAGDVECARYDPRPLAEGEVRVRSVRTAISGGTEMTLFGEGATNVYLHKRWNEKLRIFESGTPTFEYPVVTGYRAAGEVVESRAPDVPRGTRVFGAWRHTEFVTLSAARARAQRLPDGLTWDDGVDLGQMGPICVNAVAHAEGEQSGRPAVVFGAGVIGLITAQVVRATGADPVYVVDRLPSRLETAESLGFEPLDPAASGDVAALLKRRHGADEISVAWECTGSSRALHEATRVVRRRGLVIAVGFYQDDAIGLRLGEEFHHNGIRIVCGQIGNIHASETQQSLRGRTIRMALSGRLRLASLPRLTVPVERVADGVAALQRPAEVLQVAISYD